MTTRSEKYTKLGRKIIRKEFPEIVEGFARVVFLESDEEKENHGKTVFADCRLVNKQYEWCCRYDFMITVYEPNVEDFDDEQIYILLKHELMHVGIKQDGNEPSFYIVPHDVEEFDSIIAQHGIYWPRRK